MLKRNHRMTAILLVIALLLACAPIATDTPPVVPPTFDPSSLSTIIAQTAGAAATQTFILLPTLTPTMTVTKTPTETPTSTPTFLFILATPTVPSSTPTMFISSKSYDCLIIGQQPVDNTSFAGGADFAASWRVINNGANAWDENSVDYHYFNGDQIHKTPAYDLATSVPTGGQTDIIVNMKAPKEADTYSTAWSLRVGGTDFCRLKLTIVVK